MLILFRYLHYIEFMKTNSKPALLCASEAYVTSIPSGARESVTRRNHLGVAYRIEFYIGREMVGLRTYNKSGSPQTESSFKSGKRHGRQYRWHENGVLSSAEPYEDGVPHGTAHQFDTDGRLIGTYTLDRGTGIDLWRQSLSDGRVELSEVHYMKDGQPHGCEWWLSEGQIWQERHWQEGLRHGIERYWRDRPRLSRGYPKYWIKNVQVNKAKYLRAAQNDPTLPAFKIEENSPLRTFPPEIQRELIKERS
jgi:hypothetical protein